jgi:hypothetical protein
MKGRNVKLQLEGAQKNDFNAVAELGCGVCRRIGYPGTPAELHVLDRSQEVIPLCPEHHRGKFGLHGLGLKEFEKHFGFTLDDLLADTNSLTGKKQKPIS